MRRLIVFAMVLGICGAAKAQAPAVSVKTEAVPALWTVKGVHGTVYLFGSVHVMKPDVVWETAKVKDALKASDVLYLEVADIDGDAMAKMQPIVMELGMDLQHPLSSKISKEDVELMDAAVKKLGLPGEQAFEPFQPWLADLTLAMLPAVTAGYDPKGGIDMKILAEAKGEGKNVKGFETMQEQIHFLADFPQAQQVEMLHQALVDLPKSAGHMDDMVAEWTRGDVEKIASMENDDLKAKYPDLYKKLLVERNEKFADTLAGLLKDPKTGTVFVTIGAAHLAGPDSVIKMLGTRGYKAERVE